MRAVLSIAGSLSLVLSGVSSAHADSASLLALLERPLPAMILSDLDAGASLSSRVLGRPIIAAEAPQEMQALYDRIETLRGSSDFPDELEARLRRIEDGFDSDAGALSADERARLEAAAARELRFEGDALGGLRFVAPLASPEAAAEDAFLRGTHLRDLTLGREFSALARPSVTPEEILRLIREERGGTISADPTIPGKLVLKDGEGLKWGAEVDGRLPGSGGVYNVLEVQTPPLNADQEPLVDLPLRALLRAGAEPNYAVGGGHIHIDTARYLAKRPFRFASLVNYLLNYEELLNYVFANPGRAHATRKLSDLVVGESRQTMSEYLGSALNRAIDSGDPARAQEALESFAMDVVGTRNVDINLHSWRGSTSKKTHGTLELRFFNTPKLAQEAVLEDRLVRAITEHAVAAEARPIRYAPLADRLTGEATYYDSARLEADFRRMTDELGLDYDEYKAVFLDRLSERRHPGG